MRSSGGALARLFKAVHTASFTSGVTRTPSAAMSAVIQDPANDAILVMNVPTALASATDAADAVVAVAREHRSRVLHPKPIFAVWVGQDKDAPATKDPKP